MKWVITSVVLVISFVSLLILGLVSRVQAGEGECSNASIKGSYVISCEGTFGGTSIAALGVFIADGKGNASEVEAISFNGGIHQGETFTVKYTVNEGCTGTHTATGTGSFFNGAIFYGDIVIDDNKKEIRYISTNDGAVVLCNFRKQ